MTTRSTLLPHDFLLVDLPAFTSMVPYASTAVVVDTNILIEELIYIARHPGLETRLCTLTKTRRINLYVPKHAIQEIRKYYHVISEKAHISMEQVERLWRQTFEPYVRIIPEIERPQNIELENRLRDKNDEQILRAALAVGTRYFLSRDKDLTSLGVATSNYIEVMLDLRRFHDAQSVIYSLKIGGTTYFLVGVEAVRLLYKSFRGLMKILYRSPSWIKVLLLALLVLLVAHQDSRRKIMYKAKNAIELCKEIYPELAQGWMTLVEVVEQAQKQRLEAAASLEAHMPRIPIVKRKTALRYIIEVLSTSASPLTPAQIAERLKSKGYITSNPRFTYYVRQILKKHKFFSEVGKDQWIMGIPGSEFEI
jgi:predicted nucleic acid-binding protein